MAGKLSPRGKEDAQMKIRFVRYEEVPSYFNMDEELLYAYAKAAGAVYQLAKIRLVKIELLEEFMKHLTKVGKTAKLIQRKYVRVGSLLMWSFVKVASDADKKIDELFQAFLLREENADGNLSEKIG